MKNFFGTLGILTPSPPILQHKWNKLYDRNLEKNHKICLYKQYTLELVEPSQPVTKNNLKYNMYLTHIFMVSPMYQLHFLYQ